MGAHQRAPRNPSRHQRSSAKIAQTWHYTLRKQPTGLNDINALRAQGPVCCSCRVQDAVGCTQASGRAKLLNAAVCVGQSAVILLAKVEKTHLAPLLDPTLWIRPL